MEPNDTGRVLLHALDRNELARKVRRKRDFVRHDQLAMYCQYLPQFAERYTPGRRVTAWGQRFYLRGTDPYNAAGQASTEELERLWEEDDWGQAWESFDLEQREIWEYDDGLIAAYDDVLDMLGVER